MAQWKRPSQHRQIPTEEGDDEEQNCCILPQLRRVKPFKSSLEMWITAGEREPPPLFDRTRAGYVWENRAMTSKVLLRPPSRTDEPEFLAAARGSREFHRPWTSAPTSPTQFNAYVEKLVAPDAYGFLVCNKLSGRIAGVINITNIIYGAFRSGYLGYYAFAGYERQGLMQEGLQAVTRHAFRTLKLHRLEANIQPDNAASVALVASCGFTREGYSPRYLKICGRWRDHERWALVDASSRSAG